ncbi:acyltransferase [Alteromonas sp. K632G]|jgi:virginiamycin A acetyltransferase|uniref:acyltransferase n=1 Tax=Alteromonas sp. K632G TaxID=2820757 RepID=UPI000C0C9976|nr:acyltransferase [Alteromonas sp. K632G]MBO7922651.1 acyltransferase [Alteromonas sp. K632G]PHS59398.1 MAG: acetyltransferase [Alteromonas sp.]
MKTIIKTLFFVCCFLAMLPFSVTFKILAHALNQDQLTSSFSQFLSILPGKTGSYLRAGFYRVALTYCSPDAMISFGTLLSQQDTEIGEGVYIGPQCNIGKCCIGKNTLVGSGVHIMSGKGQHNFSDPDVPIKDQGGSFTKVIIGQNCWIGNCALIMANVGAGSVVAAGAVVINDVPDGVIVGGNPAKVISERR